MNSSAKLLLFIAAYNFFISVHTRLLPHPAAYSGRASCIPHERDALLTFKSGITKDSENLLASWERGHDCCEWGGVTCSNQTGHVLKLELRDAILEGQISSSLLSLDYLEYLDVSSTALQGPTSIIPNFFGSLKNLRHLDISETYFSGRLPSFLGNLSKLEYLDVSHTLFSGVIPPQLGNLSNLQTLSLGGIQNVYSTDISWLGNLHLLEYLDMSYVNLSLVHEWAHVVNTIPSLQSLNFIECSLSSANQSLAHINLTKLTMLLLDNNYFDHPTATSWFWNVTSLRDLALFETYLYGPFPDAIRHMKFLEWLDFSYNGNRATMDVDLKDLCALKYLWLDASLSFGSINDLVEKLPRCPANNLQTLSSSANNMIGFLPDRMVHLTSLVALDLSNNSISGDIPSEIGNCTSLNRLFLQSNKLSGQIPKLPKSIHLLDLSVNSLSGPFPLDLGAANIVEITLFSNYFTGRIPESICHLHDLVVLDLGSNFLDGELPKCFHMTSMVFLLLSNNRISGKLPSSLQSCSKLAFIDLSRNKLYGTIPQWIGDLVNLTFLQLSHNMLYGDIPYSITNLTRLRHLSLAGNNISGTIPWSLSKFVSMVEKLPNETIDDTYFWYRRKVGPFEDVLSVVTKRQELKYGAAIFLIVGIDLSLNNLTGGIPDEITSLSGLLFLNFSWNQLVGKIPEKIGDMELLESLDLSRNNLCLEIPPGLSSLTYLSYLDLSYNNLTGRLPTGRQLDTLYTENPSMYDGNSGLCGPPLPDSCLAGNASDIGNIKASETDSELIPFYFGLGSGFVVGFLFVLFSLPLKML